MKHLRGHPISSFLLNLVGVGQNSGISVNTQFLVPFKKHRSTRGTFFIPRQVLYLVCRFWASPGGSSSLWTVEKRVFRALSLAVFYVKSDWKDKEVTDVAAQDPTDFEEAVTDEEFKKKLQVNLVSHWLCGCPSKKWRSQTFLHLVLLAVFL